MSNRGRKIIMSVETENNIVNDFKNGVILSNLEAKYPHNRETIRKVLFKHDLIDSPVSKRKCYFRGSDPARKELKEKILKRYEEEKNINILVEEFGIEQHYIWDMLRNETTYMTGYSKDRKYWVNDHYFDVIDTEEKAYFIGLLYADGTNSLKKTEVNLRLQEGDIEILEKYKNILQPEKQLYFNLKKSEKHQNIYALVINSKAISVRLNELGVVPNKTFLTTFPEWLDEKLYSHFIRGYFDGDGCIHIRKKDNMLCFSFTGTELLLTKIMNILIENCNLNTAKFNTRFPERNNCTRSFAYGGNGNARKFYDFIYKDAIMFLKRKKDKFELVINK
jgi:hypothetical protein